PIELGVDAFPETAKYLVSAARSLGLRLELSSPGYNDLTDYEAASFGVYDGRSWAYTEPRAGSFFDSGWWGSQTLSRYGTSVATAATFIKTTHEALNSLYRPFSSLTDVIYNANLQSETQNTAQEVLNNAGVSIGFRRELLNAWVRGRYAQNLGTISALAAFMAADSVGQFNIGREDDMATLWKRMVEDSGAVVKLGSHVDSLQKMPWGGWELTSSTQFNTTTTPYDAVVLATPFGLSSISLPSTVEPLAKVTYNPLHITLFISSSRLSPHPFHGRKDIPEVVLTTPCSWEYDSISAKSGEPGLGQPRFWSLSRVRTVIHEGERRWLYKVVSATKMTQEDLQELVGVGEPINWVYRHFVSFIHPLIVPRRKFSTIRLDENLWYTGAMEELATGVEMASVIGANIARLMHEQWKKE
ncbi:Prenylcysteine lyase-domain-containing protein, partial [Sphaerosporella brunnea]